MVLPDLLVLPLLLAAPLPQAGRPPRALKVEVVDAAGRPIAGVPVGWDQPGGIVGWEGKSARTDEHGIATITDSDPFEFRGRAHDLGFAIPCFEGGRLSVPSGSGLTEPVRLILPHTRRVEVEFVDEQGQFVDGFGDVGLNLLGPQTDGAPSYTAPARAPIVAGRAAFPWVGRTGRLAFHGRVGTRTIDAVEGDERKGVSLAILGSDATTTRVRVTAGPAGPTIHGRLRRPDGSPAADATVDVYESYFSPSFTICRSGPEPPFARIRTDARGCFLTQVPSLMEHAWAVLAIPDDFGGTAEAVAIDLGRTGRSGASGLDVGEPRLVEATLLAAGRVVDEQGRPFGGAQIRASLVRAKPDAADPLEGVEYERRFALFERPQAAAARGDGAFELRSFTPVAGARVGFSVSGPLAEGHSDPRFPLPTVALGTRDLLLQLHRTGSIETALVLPAGAAAASITCQSVEPGRPPSIHGHHFPISFADDVVLDFQLPGRHDLVVLADAALPKGAELLRIAGLDVKSGERCDDRRLASIDLTMALVVHDLRIVGPDGRLVRSGKVYGAPLDRERMLPAEFPIEPGRCLVPVVRGLEAQAVVEIVAPGFAAKVVRAEEFDHEIELAPAPVLTLQVLPWPFACSVDAVLTQSLRDDSAPEHVANQLSVSMPFWRGDTTEIALPRSGSWHVQLVVRVATRSGTTSLDVSVTNPFVDLGPEQRSIESWVRIQPQHVAEIERLAAR